MDLRIKISGEVLGEQLTISKSFQHEISWKMGHFKTLNRFWVLEIEKELILVDENNYCDNS